MQFDSGSQYAPARGHFLLRLTYPGPDAVHMQACMCLYALLGLTHADVSISVHAERPIIPKASSMVQHHHQNTTAFSSSGQQQQQQSHSSPLPKLPAGTGVAPPSSMRSPKPHSEHSTAGSLESALNRTLSWDLPQPPRRKEKVRQNIEQLAPRASGCLGEDDGDADLPTPEPFKIKMVETISRLPRAKREVLLDRAGFNVFCLRSDQVWGRVVGPVGRVGGRRAVHVNKQRKQTSTHFDTQQDRRTRVWHLSSSVAPMHVSVPVQPLPAAAGVHRPAD